jgi:hypothetical protein
MPGAGVIVEYKSSSGGPAVTMWKAIGEQVR